MFSRAEGEYGEKEEIELNEIYILEMLSPLGAKNKQEKK